MSVKKLLNCNTVCCLKCPFPQMAATSSQRANYHKVKVNRRRLTHNHLQ